ncbi:hypothetical protein CLAIMM_00978, partial [Cladophialophora immunda]
TRWHSHLVPGVQHSSSNYIGNLLRPARLDGKYQQLPLYSVRQPDQKYLVYIRLDSCSINQDIHLGLAVPGHIAGINRLHLSRNNIWLSLTDTFTTAVADCRPPSPARAGSCYIPLLALGRTSGCRR